MIKEIITYLAAQLGLVIGTDLIMGHWDSRNQDNCSLIFESGGVSNYYMADVAEYNLQMISRGTTYMTARDEAWDIYSLIHGIDGMTGVALTVVDSGPIYRVNTVEALNIPISIGRDAKGRYRFSTNYLFRMQET